MNKKIFLAILVLAPSLAFGSNKRKAEDLVENGHAEKRRKLGSKIYAPVAVKNSNSLATILEILAKSTKDMYKQIESENIEISPCGKFVLIGNGVLYNISNPDNIKLLLGYYTSNLSKFSLCGNFLINKNSVYNISHSNDIYPENFKIDNFENIIMNKEKNCLVGWNRQYEDCVITDSGNLPLPRNLWTDEIRFISNCNTKIEASGRQVYQVEMSSDFKKLLVVTNEGLYFFDCSNSADIKKMSKEKIQVHAPQLGGFVCVRFIPNSHAFIFVSRNAIRVYLPNRDRIKTEIKKEEIKSADINQKGDRLVTADSSNKIIVYEIPADKNTKLEPVLSYTHNTPVETVKFDRDYKNLILIERPDLYSLKTLTVIKLSDLVGINGITKYLPEDLVNLVKQYLL